MSGFPGKDETCKRYRNPDPCRKRRTDISGWVFLPRMRDIISDRLALVTESGMVRSQIEEHQLSPSQAWHRLFAIHCANRNWARLLLGPSRDSARLVALRVLKRVPF